MIYGMPGIGDTIGAAGLLMGLVSLGLHLRERKLREREVSQLRGEMEHGRVECLGEIGRLGASIEKSKQESQASAELLHDGRMSLPARARAIRMLRSGMSPETAAAE